MPEQERSVAFPALIESQLRDHLIRKDGQEDLVFSLWTPSEGHHRFTALVYSPIYPAEDDRQIHGNVSFNSQYFERVCSIAAKEKCGIAFLHSHPGPGWQNMSRDDIIAERKMAGAVGALTELPLVGMTVGADGTWSARMWEYVGRKKYRPKSCISVRSVGEKFDIDFDDRIIAKPAFRELFKRTVTVWGEENHATLARLRIGFVGLGSVGSVVAESLARMGIGRFVLIDFDEIQQHNLDRQLGATIRDVGRLKISIAERQIRRSGTSMKKEIVSMPYSVAEREGYQAALDCDVLFSCVDRPRARRILNHFAYAHLIPVIDGGIEARFKRGEFSGADWQVQTVSPGKPCLKCLGAYDPADVSTEEEGMLDDPSYLKGLPPDHRFKRNENVFPFSANLASLEVLQLVALVTEIAGIASFGVQRYRYNPGILDVVPEQGCREDCESLVLTGRGDSLFHLYGQDLTAQAARKRQGRS
jgi:molybdopterin/thiamine biosynthesis adenylyltransferase